MSTPENNQNDVQEIDPFNSFISPNNPTVTTTHFHRHHVASLDADIIIRQIPSQGLSFQLWPAATTLYSLLDRHRLSPTSTPLLSAIPTGVRTRILELGSGTGLVGIAAAAILGADVTVTDLSHVIPNLKFNVEANAELIASAGGSVEAKEMRWGNVDQMEMIGRDYDVILGSDVVYHDDLYVPLLETLKYLLLPKNEGEGEDRVFLMGHLKRWKKEATFFRRARKWFDVKVIHQDCPSDGKRVGVTVYRFAGKHSLGSGSSSGCDVTEPKPPNGFHMVNGVFQM